MTGHTHDLAEWVAFLSLGIGVDAALSVPYFLLVDAEVWAWPRPLVGVVDRARPSARVAADRVLVVVSNARFDAREMAADARLFARLSLREAALTGAALLALLTINPGDTR
jgi:hypothetical protein